MPEFEPVLLANIHKPDSHTRPVYEAAGGYRALRKALKDLDPAQVTEEVKESRLRGRGGAGFPTGIKWTFLPKDHPGPIYFCLNADESEPGTFNNRILMEEDPHQVIEGLILSCYATGATTAYIYLRYEYPLCFRRLQAAIDECYAAGYLGKNILGSGFSLGRLPSPRSRRLHLRRGDGPDREPRGQAGLASHQAAVSGRGRRLSQADGRQQRRDGGLRDAHHRPWRDWFQSIGVPPDPDNPRDPGSFGPKLYCLSGHVEKPGCYEAPLGIPTRQLIDEFGGGVWKGRAPRQSCRAESAWGCSRPTSSIVRSDFNGPGQVRLPGPGHGGCRGAGRNRLDRRFPAQQLPLLRPRKLRTMHALPRRHVLVAEHAGPHPGGARAA